MSAQQKAGSEPAYPVRGFVADASGALCGETVQHAGLTKRELFAAMLAQGIMANPSEQMVTWDEEKVAFAAVQHADALIAELNKEPTA